jgi:hypothetical protein
MQQVLGLLLGRKLAGADIDHKPAFNAILKNKWNFTSTAACAFMELYGQTFTFTFT